ncbi:MAG: SMC family ATPase [Actinomycetes bacterium]|nr:MAG: hypothetical protein DIU67_07275 [Actinomycetota bacterium]
MRPVRIEMEGFSAFRSRVVVDFARALETDTAFFSLSGATGSGKSSLIDAMIFALYGRIPRLGQREVAPVISAGADRCRVRFDFEADGSVFTAVREVRRTAGGGASVREARLQHGDQVLHDGAAAVTEGVEVLLGLGFDDFTRTVVLPQGDFARFLHATPKERQDLLRGLLGMDVYTKVRELARERKAAADARVDVARARLESLQVPPAEEIDALRERVASLEKLESGAAGWEQELADLKKSLDAASAEVERLDDAVTRLSRLDLPEGIDELARMAAEAAEAVAGAEDELARVTRDRLAVEEEMSGLPDAGTLQAQRRLRREREDVAARLAELDLDPARRALAAREEELAAAEEAAAAARRLLDETRMGHAAHALAETLVAGAACPVCRQEVAELPELEALADLEGLEEDLARAERAVAEARAVAAKEREGVTRLEAEASGLEARLAALDADLAGVPDDDELERLEGVLAGCRERLAGLRQAEEEARRAAEAARRRREDLVDQQRSLGRELQRARDSVADLKPPVSESDDVAVQWKELLAWRDDELSRVRTAVEEARARAVGVQETVDRRLEEIADVLAAHDVVVAGSVLSSVTRALERARHSLELAEGSIAEAARLEEEIQGASSEAAVAKALADHLRADGFEKWMMGGALRSLVAGANELLAELSDGGYSLTVDDGVFEVVDHRNADELRPVTTLSGGETFLVSLALALSLAEIHAAHGEARLDAVILDEGFGTLDEETLDTVASLLEDLAGTRGLMVGVITHVKELAERAPVRFEVHRGPKGSEVREVA